MISRLQLLCLLHNFLVFNYVTTLIIHLYVIALMAI